MHSPTIAMDKTCWFIIQNQEYVLLTKQHTFPTQGDILSLETYFLRQFGLGQANEIDYFCAEINLSIHLNDFHAVSLKEALSMVYPEQYAMGVKAYSVMHWDRNHQFCGRCATPTIHRTPHFERVCPSCKLSFFPRISPSIIVLIHRGDELIMARSPHFMPGIYGLIAGFVEMGESLEEAIHREVKEEVGLQIKNLIYRGSQPWPFPDSLMLGFTAEYASGELVIDQNEIEAAGWYRYDNLPGRPSLSFSIGSKLLDDFVQLCTERKKKSDD